MLHAAPTGARENERTRIIGRFYAREVKVVLRATFCGYRVRGGT